MKLRIALLVSIICFPAFVGAQVDCTKDQLNPACAPYVLKHSVAEVPLLGKWPNPPLQPLPLAPIRPATVALIPTPVVTQPTPIKPHISQPQETVQTTNPAPPTSASGCDSDCMMQRRNQNYQQLGAGAGTFAVAVVSLAIQHHRNKKFCSTNPESCLNGHPCSFDSHFENMTAATISLFKTMKEFPDFYAAKMPTLHNDSVSEWRELRDSGCALFPGICYHDLDGNLQRCPRR
jgi:hypothetical protein